MKFIILFACLFAVAMARPDVETVRYDSDVQPENFKFGFQTSDGSSHDSEGHLANVGSDHEAIQVKGQYSFVDKEGHTHTVTYTADENGFVAHGDDIPHA